ncbi:MAG: hypothetical protein ACKO7W_04060 [Elainella sp.]
MGLVANGQRKDIFSSYGDYSYWAYATRNNAATAADSDEWEVSD